MFSGIVKGQGRILDARATGGDRRLVIGTAGLDPGAIGLGDSIAINGVCLTAVDPQEHAFAADVSAETLSRTTLGQFGVDDAVNLEPSLRLGETIDGHLVYGHVDGVGTVVSLTEAARSLILTIEVPPSLGRYLAVKGSIAVDGISLTINAVAGHRFTVNIIPHTRESTDISGYRNGTPVNIEVDMIARYLERLLTAGPAADALTRETLERYGFIESK
jgi:riboflavin synthase